MKKAGCWQIAFGFEFGEDRILALVQKGGKASIEQSRLAAEMAAQAGLIIDGHFLLGYPGETETTILKTIALARSLPVTFAHFYAAAPFPGSGLYEEASRSGWIRQYDWKNFGQDASAIVTPELSSEQINHCIRRAYREFYFRFAAARRILSIPSTVREFYSLLNLAYSFCRQFIFAKRVRARLPENKLL